ncbi:hypothetical protein IDH28_02900 [Pelagibacterales bacterium SAG-MED31]|nr:hypothetical protein [Pelagibacterales bacterium SAG-MED31]
MKINPENFVIEDGLSLKYKSFFISGNDEGYILALKNILVKSFTKNGFIKKNLTSIEGVTPDLFKIKKKNIYICEKYIGNGAIQEIENDQDVLIFFEKTSPKNKSIKKFFSESRERVLIECYELDKDRKKNILNGFIKKHKLVFDNEIYWLLLDLLDNRFAILINELEKILLLDNKNDAVSLSSALDMDRLTSASKFFFKIHLARGEINHFLNSSINSLSDFYSYFSYFKTYSLILLGSKNSNELENKVPRYLFKEKQGLISLYNSLNKNKKNMLSLLIYKTEKLVRKNPNLYKHLFFRFVLNYKKIIS